MQAYTGFIAATLVSIASGVASAGPATTLTKGILRNGDQSLAASVNGARREVVKIGKASSGASTNDVMSRITRVEPPAGATVRGTQRGSITTVPSRAATSGGVPLHPFNAKPTTVNVARGQSAVPRNAVEEKLFSDVQASPTQGNNAKVLPGLNRDTAYGADAGWTKMRQNIKPGDGSSATVHYQYNFPTNTVTDVKATHVPKPAR